MAEITCAVSPVELLHLASLAGGEWSAVSPLHAMAAAPADAARLQAAGLVAGGKLTPAGIEVAELLARPDAFGALVVVAEGDYQHAVYSATGRHLALTSYGDEFLLQYPAPDAEAVLRAALGAGESVAAEFDTALPPAQAVALLAAVDLQRRAHLAAMLDAAEAPAPLLAADVAAWAAAPADSSQWFTAVVRDLPGCAVGEADAARAVDALVTQGILARDGSALAAGDVVDAMARAFIVLKSLIRVRAARAAGNEAVSVDLRAAQGLGGEVLLWESDGAHVQMHALAAEDLVALAIPLLDGTAEIAPAS